MVDRRRDKSFIPHELVQVALDHNIRADEASTPEDDANLANMLLVICSTGKGIDPTIALPIRYLDDGRIEVELPDQSPGQFNPEGCRPLYRNLLTSHNKARIGKYISASTAVRWGLIHG